MPVPAVPNDYLYNGKEYQDELGVGWSRLHRDGARMYDPTVGRWNGVDALVEEYVAISPFAYVANNPMVFVDPNGKEIVIALYETIVGDDGEETRKVTRLRYDGKNLLNEEGNIYQGENQFALDALTALNHLRETGASLINFGEEGEGSVDILSAFIGEHNPDITIEQGSGANSFTPGMEIINWAPRMGRKFLKGDQREILFPNEEDYGYNSPASVLAHEFIHAYNSHYDPEGMKNRADEKLDRTQYPFFPNAEERQTTLNWANQANDALGEDRRVNYSVRPYMVVSPISTDPLKKD